MGVILRARPVRGESHIQRNANREVSTLQITINFLIRVVRCGYYKQIS